MPAIQTEGDVFVQISFNGTWLQSTNAFSYVQPLDATVGKSLYNTGGDAAMRRGGAPAGDSTAEVLFVASPAAGGANASDFSGNVSVTVADAVSGKVLGSVEGAVADGQTRVSVPFPLPAVPCAAAAAASRDANDGLTEDDVAAGLVCNTSLRVTGVWPATGAKAARLVRFYAGPWGATTAALDFRGGAILVEDGRRLAPAGVFYGFHAPVFEPYYSSAIQPQQRTGDTIAMPYLNFGPLGQDPVTLGKPFLDASYGRGVKVLFDIAETLAALDGAQGNATRTAQLWAQIEASVIAVKDHPALLGWYIDDDTIGRPLSLCRRVYLLLRRLDPWHPTFAAVAGSGNAWQYHSVEQDLAGGAAGLTFDVPSYEMYIENDPAYEIPTIPLYWPMRWAPQWITGYLGGGPLGVESANRLQGVISAMYHAKGSLLWDYWPFSDSAWPYAVASGRWTNAMFGEIGAQIVSPKLNGRLDLKPTSPSQAVVAVQYTDEMGCSLVMVANTGRAPTTFSVASDAIAEAEGKRVPVLFERRHTVVAGGAIAEAIDGYGTRLVRINCSAEGGGGGPGHGYGTDDYNRDDIDTDDGGGGPASPNRVYNPSFEDFVAPSQPAGSFFSPNCPNASACVGVGVIAQAARHVDSTVSRTLGHSLRVTGFHLQAGSSVAEPQLMLIYDGQDKNPGGRPLAIATGTEVALSMWVRPSVFAEGWPGLRLSFRSDAFEPCGFDLVAMKLPAWEWSRLACNRTATATGTINIGVIGAGVAWVDDLSAIIVHG